jgi:ProP effector
MRSNPASTGRPSRRAFRIDGPRKPLKIGIEDDLALRGTSRGVIQRGLDRYCSNSRYRVALQEGAARVGLAGQPAGVVTADEAADARQQLAEEKQSVAAKRLRQQQMAEKKPKPKSKAPAKGGP